MSEDNNKGESGLKRVKSCNDLKSLQDDDDIFCYEDFRNLSDTSDEEYESEGYESEESDENEEVQEIEKEDESLISEEVILTFEEILKKYNGDIDALLRDVEEIESEISIEGF